MLKNVVVPEKNWNPKLYEILRHLQLQAQQAAGGIAAIGRGEAPDGSGNTLIDTTQFFLLPGRSTGQIGYGSTAANGTLTFSSTSDADKGFIYFGYPNHRMALDEDAGFFGIGTDTPAARLHVRTATLGTSTVGATGTPHVRFTYASTDKLDIVPLLNDAGVVDIALNVNSGSIQFLDSSLGSAGMRIAFSSSRSFLQAGRINGSSVVQNRNLTFGGMNATVGASLSSNFQTVSLFTTSGSDSGGSPISANDAIVAINLSADDYLSSLAASRFSLLVGPRASSPTCAPIVVENGSTTVNGFEYRDVSSGSSPAKVLGNRKIAMGPGLGSLTSEGSLIGYITNTESFRLSPLTSNSNLQWGFLSPAGLTQLAHAVLTSAWSDSLSGNATRLEIGDVANSVRAATLISSGGNRFNRFGICSIDGVTIENAFLSGGSTALSAPLAMLYLVNNATDGDNAKVLLYVNSKRTGQTGNLVQFVSGVSSTIDFVWNARNVLETGRIKTAVLFTDDPATIANAKLLGFSTASITTGQTRTLSAQDYTGTIPVVGNDDPAVAAGSLGRVSLTNQSANIASTNLTNGGLTGQIYMCEVFVFCTASDAGAGTLTTTVSWTDTIGATSSSVLRSLTATGRSSLRFAIFLSSGEISYAASTGGTFGTARYDIHIRLTALG